MKALYCTLYNMLGETEKSSDVCRTASLSEMGHEQRAATGSTVTGQRWKTSLSLWDGSILMTLESARGFNSF